MESWKIAFILAFILVYGLAGLFGAGITGYLTFQKSGDRIVSDINENYSATVSENNSNVFVIGAKLYNITVIEVDKNIDGTRYADILLDAVPFNISENGTQVIDDGLITFTSINNDSSSIVFYADGPLAAYPQLIKDNADNIFIGRRFLGQYQLTSYSNGLPSGTTAILTNSSIINPQLYVGSNGNLHALWITSDGKLNYQKFASSGSTQNLTDVVELADGSVSSPRIIVSSEDAFIFYKDGNNLNFAKVNVSGSVDIATTLQTYDGSFLIGSVVEQGNKIALVKGGSTPALLVISKEGEIDSSFNLDASDFVILKHGSCESAVWSSESGVFYGSLAASNVFTLSGIVPVFINNSIYSMGISDVSVDSATISLNADSASFSVGERIKLGDYLIELGLTNEAEGSAQISVITTEEVRPLSYIAEVYPRAVEFSAGLSNSCDTYIIYKEVPNSFISVIGSDSNYLIEREIMHTNMEDDDSLMAEVDSTGDTYVLRQNDDGISYNFLDFSGAPASTSSTVSTTTSTTSTTLPINATGSCDVWVESRSCRYLSGSSYNVTLDIGFENASYAKVKLNLNETGFSQSYNQSPFSHSFLINRIGTHRIQVSVFGNDSIAFRANGSTCQITTEPLVCYPDVFVSKNQSLTNNTNVLLSDLNNISSAMVEMFGSNFTSINRTRLALVSGVFKEFFDVQRTLDITNDESVLTTELTYKLNDSSGTLRNLVIHDIIPKSFASSSDDIIIDVGTDDIVVVNDDPEYLIKYDTFSIEPDETLAISYTYLGRANESTLNQSTSPKMYLVMPSLFANATTTTTTTTTTSTTSSSTTTTTIITTTTTMIGTTSTIGTSSTTSLGNLTGGGRGGDMTGLIIGIVILAVIGVLIYFFKDHIAFLIKYVRA